VPKLLKNSEIVVGLRRLNGWKHKGSSITKTFKFKNFMDGIAFIERVAKVAEKQEHHPDIHVRYTTVTFSIQTHSEGGVTRWDLDLAKAIDAIPRIR
jgi:4a-hydroxytetrahydrobiopterin dehydratase